MNLSPQRMVQLHFALTILWLVLLVPTLVWWRESIVWLVIISWYANFVGQWSAYQAARSELRQEENT